MQNEPTGFMDSVLSLVDPVIEAIKPIITTELIITLMSIIFAVAATLMITHYVKVAAEHFLVRVTKEHSAWMVFCMGASIMVGASAGFILFIMEDMPWWVIPSIAILPGVTWRYLREQLPESKKRIFLTQTDKKFKGSR